MRRPLLLSLFTSVGGFRKCPEMKLVDTPSTISFNYNHSYKWTKHTIDTNKYTFLTLPQLCQNIPVTNTAMGLVPSSKFIHFTLRGQNPYTSNPNSISNRMRSYETTYDYYQ